MIFRMFFCVLLIAASPATAGTVDDIQRMVFDESGTKIKEDYRRCTSDSNCTSLLILCRWRALNSSFTDKIVEQAKKATLECKWPKPPAQAPIARCIERLCDIPPDGRYY